MADIVGSASTYTLPPLGATQQLNANASLSPTSLLNVPSLTKPQAAAAATSDPATLIMQMKGILSTGFAQNPVVQPAQTPADFYRNGAASGTYNVLPRLIDDSADNVASIRMMGKATPTSTGADIDLIPPFSKFFLESVQEGHTERSQIVETFGDFYVFFFGERPPVYTFTGTLINGKSINWAEDWMFYYHNFLRGTQCVELNAKLVLTYGYRQIEGFIMGMNTTTQASNPNGVGLQFQVLVIDRKIFNLSIDFGLISTNGTFSTDQVFLNTLTKGLSQSGNSNAYSQAAAITSGTAGASSSQTLPAANAGAISQQFGINAIPSGSGGLTLG